MSVDLIHQQLRAARRIAGRSQQSVADAVGVGQSVISEWENGVCGITLASLRSWARALDHAVVLLPMSGPVSTSPETGPPEDQKRTEEDCVSCGEETPRDECPKSERPCGHHCNHSWSHDACDWCGESFSGNDVPGEPCQPIGCDNGIHLPGCQYIEVDAPAGSSTENGEPG